jgi:CBS domain-containing protein
MNVRDVMTTKVVAATADTPLKEVARLFAENEISGMPVVGEGGAVIGVVSEADFLVRAQKQERPSLFASLFEDADARRAREEKLTATTAGEAMSAPPIVIGPDEPAREAAARLTKHRINRLPVIEDGKLVGVVSRADLVSTYLVPDEELARRISNDVVRETMWIDPRLVSVEVRDGIAHLGGTVDRRTTAAILERLVGRLEGVVGVESDLRWERDDRDIEPVGRVEREPTAASVMARDRPR